MTIVVSDSFTRANSNTVGAADIGGTWTEGGSSADNERIVSNELELGNGGSAAKVYLDHGSLTRPISLSCKVITSTATRSARIGFRCDTDIINTHISLNFTTGGFTLAGNNNGSSTSTVESLTGTFYIWLDEETNGGNVNIKSYISTTSTKPGSPNLTLTGIAVSTGTKIGFFYDSNAAGQHPMFDDIQLRDGAPFNLTAATGTYTLTGVAASLLFIHKLSATVGSYVLTGFDTLFKRYRVVNQEKGSAPGIINQSKASAPNITNQARSSAPSITNQSKS